jgi:hypothetical protein
MTNRLTPKNIIVTYYKKVRRLGLKGWSLNLSFF